MSTNHDYELEASCCFEVAAIYSFATLNQKQINELLIGIKGIALGNEVKGTLLIAFEGINGTLCGPKRGVSEIILTLKEFIQDGDFEVKISQSSQQVFKRLKVRQKAEIVTMGLPNINPLKSAGTYVDPLQWNDLINNKQTLAIDTRNNYEIAIGTFKDSINPNTKRFREFPDWVDSELIPLIKEQKPKNIAMFCTGGIRCEKATSYLKGQGIKDVYHLKGGILRYLEKIPTDESLWEGECFVFDRRVALNHKLEQGIHQLCYACGSPLKPEDIMKETYIRGIQCHQCIDKFTSQDRARFAERQLQLTEKRKCQTN